MLMIRLLYYNVPCAVVVLVNILPLTSQLHVAVKSSPNTALIIVSLTYTLLMRVAVTSIPLISVAVGGVSMIQCILYLLLLSRSVNGDTRCILTDVDAINNNNNNNNNNNTVESVYKESPLQSRHHTPTY